MLHTYRTTGPGKEYHALDLKLLYPEKENRVSFEQRWKLFHASHPDNAQVFRKTNDSLGYISENIIPAQADSRVPALLLFGNPAPQSALAGMFFSYEGAGREHRVWKIFRETQFLHFDELPEARSQVNVSMRKNLLDLSYHSPYRIGMSVYFSMPSSASDPVWSGVAGLRRLFGKQALVRIEAEEQKRIQQVINKFVNKNGKIFVFQKDAYEGLRSDNSEPYSLKKVITEGLHGTYKHANLPLICIPPTRLLLGHKALERFRKETNP